LSKRSATPRVIERSPRGAAALSVLRLEGEGAAEVLARCLDCPLPRPGRIGRRLVVSTDGPVDEVLVAEAPGGGFTLTGHGGPAARRRVVATLVAAGAVRGAAPAPTPFEAASTWLAARVALAVERDRLLADDPETRALLDRLTHPRRVCLAGPENAGKSTLFNALLERDRAITAAEGGTTRDALRAPVAFLGVPVELVDTAGVGEARADDALRAAAGERALQEARAAALLVVVLDGSRSLGEDGRRWLGRVAEQGGLVCLQKADLAAALAPGIGGVPKDACRVSAKTGEGLAELALDIATKVLGRDPRTVLAPGADGADGA